VSVFVMLVLQDANGICIAETRPERRCNETVQPGDETAVSSHYVVNFYAHNLFRM